jgi:hypothetical protein
MPCLSTSERSIVDLSGKYAAKPYARISADKSERLADRRVPMLFDVGG